MSTLASLNLVSFGTSFSALDSAFFGDFLAATAFFGEALTKVAFFFGAGDFLDEATGLDSLAPDLVLTGAILTFQRF